MAEVWDIKFTNDGKSMLLTTKSNNIYVLDAYNGEKVSNLFTVFNMLIVYTYLFIKVCSAEMWIQCGCFSKYNT